MDRLKKLRLMIDEVDRGIIKLLDRRMEIVREIGRIKRELGLKILDEEREKLVLRRAGKYREIFKKIIEYSKRIQRE